MLCFVCFVCFVGYFGNLEIKLVIAKIYLLFAIEQCCFFNLLFFWLFCFCWGTKICEKILRNNEKNEKKRENNNDSNDKSEEEEKKSEDESEMKTNSEGNVIVRRVSLTGVSPFRQPLENEIFYNSGLNEV